MNREIYIEWAEVLHGPFADEADALRQGFRLPKLSELPASEFHELPEIL